MHDSMPYGCTVMRCVSNYMGESIMSDSDKSFYKGGCLGIVVMAIAAVVIMICSL